MSTQGDGMAEVTEASGKWAIYAPTPGVVCVEFYDPEGKQLLTRSTFDKPAIEEFATVLNAVVRGL